VPSLERVDDFVDAMLIRKSILLRILILLERAFDPPTRRAGDDWNTRVAFRLLSEPRVFEEVAALDKRKFLSEAQAFWATVNTGPRRKRLRQYRNKVVVHQGQRDPAIGDPLVRDMGRPRDEHGRYLGPSGVRLRYRCRRHAPGSASPSRKEYRCVLAAVGRAVVMIVWSGT
jgi:hypothetical protein